jgi:hypothetical protein
MPYATDSDLLARVPSAASVDPAQRAVALDDAALLLDETEIGDTLVPAHAYLAAHLLASTPGSGMPSSSGPVSSLRAGEIAATFAVAMPVAGDLSTSEWGRLFLRFVPIHEGVTG